MNEWQGEAEVRPAGEEFWDRNPADSDNANTWPTKTYMPIETFTGSSTRSP